MIPNQKYDENKAKFFHLFSSFLVFKHNSFNDKKETIEFNFYMKLPMFLRIDQHLLKSIEDVIKG